MNKQYSSRGAQALFAAAFTYAFTPILVREMAPMWGDKAQVAARYLLVFIFLLLYGYFRKAKARVPASKRPQAIALGVSFALVVLFFTFSVQKTTVANSLFTHYAANIVTSFFLGTLILKEKVTGAKMVAIALALIGLSFYSSELASGSLGIIFGVLGGISAGAGNLFSKQLSGVNRSAVLRTQYGVGTILTLGVTLLSGDQVIRTASLHGVAVTIIFALVLIAAGSLLLYGYQHFDVNTGTVIMSMELVFGAILGYIFFREVPARHELLGGAFIFLGSIIGSIDPKRFYRPGRID